MANGNSTFSRGNSTSLQKGLNVTISNRFKTAQPHRSWHTHANTTFTYNMTDGKSNNQTEQIGVNTNRMLLQNDSRRVSGSGDFGIWHKTAWGDDGGLDFRTNIAHNKSNSQSEQQIQTLAQPLLSLNREGLEESLSYDYTIAPYYSFNLAHGFTFYTDYTYFQQYNEQDYLTYIVSVLDTHNSNRQVSLNRSHALVAALSYNKDSEHHRLYGRLNLTLRHADNRLHYACVPIDTTVWQHNTNQEPDLIMEKTRKARGDSCYQRTLRLHYNLRESLPPQPSQVAFNNDQDPLHIRMGNPELQPTLIHAIDVRYNMSRRRPWCNHSPFANFNVYRNSISQDYTYNPTTGVYAYRPKNVNGNWNASLRFASQGYLDKKSLFFYTVNLIGIYSRHVDYAALTDCGMPQYSKQYWATSTTGTWGLT